MALVESADVSPVVSLDERAQRIIDAFERTALTIGEELLQAKRDHPGTFMAWVNESLPFGIDQAERLMAVTRAFASADPEMMAALPRASTTLFQLSRLPAERLRKAIETGQVTPQTTYRQAMALRTSEDAPTWEAIDMPEVKPSPASEPRISADIVAKELLRFPRGQLSDDYAVKLRRWLG